MSEQAALPYHLKCCYFIMLGTTIWACILPLPVSLHMCIMACAIIAIGSFGSIEKSKSDDAEVMETQKAMMFPIIMSGVLGSLYLVFKFLPKEYINILIKAYFCFFGVLVLGQHFARLLTEIVPEATSKSLQSMEYSFRLPNIPFITGDKKDDKKEDDKKTENDDDLVKFTNLDLVGLGFACLVGVWYLTKNHWAANNLFGAFFSIEGIELLNLGSFLNGAILLSGLFFYDIFWVFGTEVMVTVAKGLDAPIKLLFPQMSSEEGKNSMLGLGDIVVPGIFIALILRYDLSRTSTGRWQDSTLPFFKGAMLAYLGGLLTTVFVMYAFETAQPALLYLVPACLGVTMLMGVVRGETQELLSYKEDVEQEGEKSDKSDKSEKSEAAKKTE